MADRQETAHTWYEAPEFAPEWQALLDAAVDAIIVITDCGVEDLVRLTGENIDRHNRLHAEIQRNANQGHFSEVELSTLLNVNRELFSSNRAVVLANKDQLLSPGQAEDFARLPGVT